MILQVVLPLPADWLIPSYARLDVDDAEVRDPATGMIGHVRDVRPNWRDGHAELLLTVEVEDAAAVSAAARRGPVY